MEYEYLLFRYFFLFVAQQGLLWGCKNLDKPHKIIYFKLFMKDFYNKKYL